MRALGLATLAVVLALLAAGLTWLGKDGPRLAPAAPTDRTRSLPPGLWFVEGHYESNALEDEPRPPRHAVILGVYPSAAGAEAAARRAMGPSVPSGLLAPGFPWVVTTRDVPLVGTPPDRIAVVVGLFEERAPAEALARALPRARAVDIAPVGFESEWTDRGRSASGSFTWIRGATRTATSPPRSTRSSSATRRSPPRSRRRSRVFPAAESLEAPCSRRARAIATTPRAVASRSVAARGAR